MKHKTWTELSSTSITPYINLRDWLHCLGNLFKYFDDARMCGNTRMICCFRSDGHIFCFQLSLMSTKIAASGENRKCFMSKIGTLYFLLLFIGVVLTVINVDNNCVFLQMLLKMIVKFVLFTLNKNVLLQCLDLRVKHFNQFNGRYVHARFLNFLVHLVPLVDLLAHLLKIKVT